MASRPADRCWANLVARGARPNAGQAVAGGHHACGHPGSVCPVVAIARESGKVAVDDRAGRRAAAAEWGVDSLRDRRVPSVGTDGQRRGRAETQCRSRARCPRRRAPCRRRSTARVTRAGMRTSAPAARAASSSSGSRTVLRGARSADMPPLGRMSTVSISSP